MPNIFNRPMFKLGGAPNSDGVGITSGLQRQNYDHGSPHPTNLEQWNKYKDKALSQMDNMGKVSTPEMAMMLSNVLGQGGSIYDMITNAQTEVMPKYANYKKIQSQLPGAKAGLFKMGAELDFAKRDLDIKQMQAEKETVQAAMERNAQKALDLEEQYGWDMEAMKENEKDYAIYKVSKQLAQRNPVSVQQARKAAMGILEGIIRAEGDAFDNYRTLDDEGRANWMQGIVDAIMTGDYSKMPTFAQGGRVGRAYGNPDPTLRATEAIDIQTPGMNEEMVATETMQAPNPSNDPFVLLRARLPKEITDDVVKLIAYNPKAFKDFAAIENQQDVINFNQTYGVELVIPTAQA